MWISFPLVNKTRVSYPSHQGSFFAGNVEMHAQQGDEAEPATVVICVLLGWLAAAR